jgi:hypothetical protein
VAVGEGVGVADGVLVAAGVGVGVSAGAAVAWLVGVGVAVPDRGVGVLISGRGVAVPAVFVPATVEVTVTEAAMVAVEPASFPCASWAASTWFWSPPNTSSPAPPLL